MNFSAITYIIDPQHEISRADPFRVLVAYSGAAECEPIYVTSYNAAFMEEPLDFSDTFSMSGIVDYPVITRRNITGTVYYHTTGTASATILEHFTGTVFPTMVATGLDRCVFCVFPDWDLLSEYIEATTPIIVITPGIYYSSLSATEILQMHTIARNNSTMFIADVQSSTRWNNIITTTIYRGSPYIMLASGKLAHERPYIRHLNQPNTTLQSYLSVSAASIMAQLNGSGNIINTHIPSYRNDSEYEGREYSNAQKRHLRSAGINTVRTGHLVNANRSGQTLYSAETLSDNLVLRRADNILIIHKFVREMDRAFRDPTYLGLSGLPRYVIKDVTRMSAGTSSYIDFSLLGRNKPLLGSPINIQNIVKVTKAVLESYPLLDQSFSVSQESFDTVKIEITLKFYGSLDYITITFQARSS